MELTDFQKAVIDSMLAGKVKTIEEFLTGHGDLEQVKNETANFIVDSGMIKHGRMVFVPREEAVTFSRLMEFITLWKKLEVAGLLLTVSTGSRDLFPILKRDAGQRALTVDRRIMTVVKDYRDKEIVVLPELSSFVRRGCLTKEEERLESEVRDRKLIETDTSKADVEVNRSKGGGSENGHSNSNFFVHPIAVLREAIQAVPQLKYAFGVLGLVAVVAIVSAWKIGYAVAVYGAVVTLILMVAVLVFAKLTQVGSKHFLRPALVLMWAFVLLTIAAGVALFSAATFKAPQPLYDLIFIKPSKQQIEPDQKADRSVPREDNQVRFTGIVFVKGQMIRLKGPPLAFVRVDLSQGTAEYNSGPMPLPQPAFEMWYRTESTFGDIVIP